MKSYKRLTERITASNTGRTVLVIPTFRHEIIEQTNRLADLEDKIENGELCDREEIKNEIVKNILTGLYERTQNHYGNKCLLSSRDVIDIAEKYGIDLFKKTEQVGNSDTLEDEGGNER